MKTLLEYCGPAMQEWIDPEGNRITLVAGRRYQIPEAIAAYWLDQQTGHWKRPDSPKGTAAAKE
jgi:hypothetical protein